MVTCDGNGGFLVSVCNSGCDKICTVMHERNHKALLEKRVPNACVGRPKGASPFPKNWEYGGIEHRQLANRLGRSSGQMNRTGSCSQMCGSYRPGGSFPY